VTDPLAGVDLDGFWHDVPLSAEKWTEPAPSDELVASIEAELGFRLPASYVALARRRNGGLVERCRFDTAVPTGWAEDHLLITGIYAIGRTSTYSLCGALGSVHMRDHWGYPDIGPGFADTPTAGHEQLMLDYRACGPDGEPRVAYVDQEDDYRITVVAPDLRTFLAGLRDDPPDP
jgi:hypothetical protein